MKVRLLTHPDALLKAFKNLVEWADTLDLAYAWLDSANLTTAAWHRLEDHKIRRVIAGVSFGGTEPAALRYLHREVPSRVRVIEDRAGTFHPKVIVGRRKSKHRAILGSSNFSPGGFDTNTELNVELDGGIDDKFFRDLEITVSDYWHRAEPLTPALLERLEQAWSAQQRPSKKAIIGSARRSGRSAMPASLDVDWAGYVELLGAQRRRHPVLRLSEPGRDDTYLGEARRAREAFKREPRFAKMDYKDARLIAGFGPEAGWYGATRGNGIWMNLVGEHRRSVARIIDPIPRRGRVSNELVLQAFRTAEALPKVKIGCTTRLLCMKRPDLFFSVNNANKRRMRELLGIAPRNAEEYLESLAVLRSFPWYRASKPADEYGRELWRNRAGLTDVIFYEPRSEF